MNDSHAMKIWYVMELTKTLTLNPMVVVPQPPPEQTKNNVPHYSHHTGINTRWATMLCFQTTNLVVLAPARVVTFPVVAWRQEYSQASIEKSYGSFVASSWNTSLKITSCYYSTTKFIPMWNYKFIYLYLARKNMNKS